ncbi:hypothetical protein GUITHDRAFT_112941 [Guillardia theta CCMP2712]|uniref:Uncharacterized protein n=1 Tax=Guillardia theta (strain CCMP2712) TaxID=905079 RepID=L1IXE5_GUITC|nr:hypothetical protein GUITHDRAFT_112941 [Guillardia theta CCMP2712]EKX40938.1 hypothetical protein GUITHDRAFT_112941 [Guillardia theta CCMP2712]|eukprot:XP_005827918.1 hypothetical protein GUITHDRAFT_112941 [Guillardia theta CCMP2712]
MARWVPSLLARSQLLQTARRGARDLHSTSVQSVLAHQLKFGVAMAAPRFRACRVRYMSTEAPEDLPAAESEEALSGDAEGVPAAAADENVPLKGTRARRLTINPYVPHPGQTELPKTPFLSSETKGLIYRLHTEDPLKNSDEALAERFGHGVVNSGYSSPLYRPDREGFRGVRAEIQEKGMKARPFPSFKDADPIKARNIVAFYEKKYDGANFQNPVAREERRLQKAAAAKVDFTPLEQRHGIRPSMSKRFEYIFADISKGVTGEQRLVLTRGKDGSLKAASHEQRYRVERRVAPPRHPRT